MASKKIKAGDARSFRRMKAIQLRLWAILRLVDAGMGTTGSLALALNVARETIWRDLVALKNQGLVSRSGNGRTSVWSTDAKPTPPPSKEFCQIELERAGQQRMF